MISKWIPPFNNYNVLHEKIQEKKTVEFVCKTPNTKKNLFVVAANDDFEAGIIFLIKVCEY